MINNLVTFALFIIPLTSMNLSLLRSSPVHYKWVVREVLRAAEGVS
jgi:hypothetical protein